MNTQKQKRIKEILSKKTVGIAGAGGLGSNAAVALARSGIGHLIIVDFDVVEERNLNRQYYFLDQLGMKKVDALTQNIHRINPQITIDSVQLKLEQGQMHTPFVSADIIIEALDDAKTKKIFIEEILEKLPNTPIVAASGVAGYGHNDRINTQHLGNLHVCYDEQAKSSEKDVLLAPKVCLMANWQANITLDLLLGDNI
ncbi:MAG: sulfur carrier protein ThiS adenylyltransferase ThiF [Candidatus Thermoplasmatota archaeon]|nr:sulfur carrier protein ThiS adenylyltransferase ThiF [Candidatus Thermoplasmatota archaeon]